MEALIQEGFPVIARMHQKRAVRKNEVSAMASKSARRILFQSAALLTACALSACSAGPSSGSSSTNVSRVSTETQTSAAAGTEAVSEPEDSSEVNGLSGTEALSGAELLSETEALSEAENPPAPETEAAAGSLTDNTKLRQMIRYLRIRREPDLTYAWAPSYFALFEQDPREDGLRGYQDPAARLQAMAPPFALPERSMKMLESRIRYMLSEESGTWSVYVKDLSRGKAFTINAQPMRSASLMKLFIMGAVYDAVSRGKLTMNDEVYALLRTMITVSSNDDANRLLQMLGDGDLSTGISVVNNYIRQAGYSSFTKEYNGFQSDSALLDPEHSNQTTARDCGRLLESVYRRQFGPRSICSSIEEWMLAQQTRYKIPAGITDPAVSVGNKTGEMETVENDAAIIYTPSGDYILCVLSEQWENKNHAIEVISAVSSEVYAYFCDDNYVRDRYSFIREHSDEIMG